MASSPISASNLPALTTALSPVLCHPPSASFLTSFLSTQRSTTPLPSLVATARLRLLNSPLALTLSPSPSSCLPSNIHDATQPERRVPGPLPLQVIDVIDLTKSRWATIEEIEMLERGEGTKGREVIRVVPGEEGESETGVGEGAKGICKLLLEDAVGRRVWGLEFRPIRGLVWGMGIGSKIVLKNVLVARGVLLLEPQTTTVVGGKIEGLHKQWMEGRKKALKEGIDRSVQAGG